MPGVQNSEILKINKETIDNFIIKIFQNILAYQHYHCSLDPSFLSLKENYPGFLSLGCIPKRL
jgi:hypothetical protein